MVAWKTQPLFNRQGLNVAYIVHTQRLSSLWVLSSLPKISHCPFLGSKHYLFRWPLRSFQVTSVCTIDYPSSFTPWQALLLSGHISLNCIVFRLAFARVPSIHETCGLPPSWHLDLVCTTLSHLFGSSIEPLHKHLEQFCPYTSSNLDQATTLFSPLPWA